MMTTLEAAKYSSRMNKAMARGMSMDAVLPADKDERVTVLEVRRLQQLSRDLGLDAETIVKVLSLS